MSGTGSNHADLLELAHAASGQVLRLAPSAGFCGISWSVGGTEHLHLSQPLGQFLIEEHTGGLPVLYPWANRLRGDCWSHGDRSINLAGHARVHRDGNGLPMHGVLLRWPEWDMTVEHGGASCTAGIDWDQHDELMSVFPFPHRLELRWLLDDQGLEVHTTVNAGEIGVPVSFGWHPYLVIPGATRDQIELRLPEVSAIALDDAGLPEADRPSTPAGGLHALADRSWDHCFSGLKDGDAVEMRGGGSGIRFEFLEEYRWLQLFSPEGAEYVCIEPMTAETGALCEGESLAPVVEPGGTFTARFRVAPIA